LMTEVLQNLVMGRHDRPDALRISISVNQYCLQ